MMSRIGCPLAAALALGLGVATADAQVGLRNLVLEANRNDYPVPGGWGYSACWGYVHPDGREYAILGTNGGTAFYNVTDPAQTTFVAFIPGLTSVWREMKAYRTWIYITTENSVASGGIAPGMQIVRMTDPEHPVLVGTYGTNFNSSHTIAADTSRALLICNGTNYRDPSTGTALGRRGVRILSLADPEAPVEIGTWPTPDLQSQNSYYVHDCVPVGNRLYASSISGGIQRIIDFTDPAQPVEIKSWTYPGGVATHSCWPDDARDRLYVCDEQNGQTLRVFDISNETAPALVSQWASNPQSIIHNPRVRGTDLWLSNYTEGIRVLDISDPSHPAEWGHADSYPGASGGYGGVWEVYPYFPSGTVIASDMNTGLYVYRPVHDFGVVHAVVRSAGSPLAGVKVYVVAPGDSALTGADGHAAFAPNPGAYTLVAKKFGYEDASVPITLAANDHLTVDLDMTAKPTTTLTGTVVDASTALPLEQAEVNLRWTPVHEHTDPLGAFDLGAIPVAFYRVDVERPGYIPRSFETTLGATSPGPLTLPLTPASFYDPLTTDQGWAVGGAGTGDNAASGTWTRVEPLGTSMPGSQTAAVTPSSGSEARSPLGPGMAPALAAGALVRPHPAPLHEGNEGEGANPGPVQPEVDRSPPTDSLCWVTGQGTSHTAIDEADVDGPGGTPGHTTLTSPPYDATGMNAPTIACWLWFYSQFGSPDDWLAVLISGDDGATWTPVDTLRGLHNEWEEHAIAVADHVAPSDHVRLRFVATDGGVPSVVEAAVDDISVYDAADDIVGAHRGPPARLALRGPSPNPARGAAALALEVPRAGRVEVEVLDLAGRRVAALHHGPAGPGTLRLRWDGRDAYGRTAPAGLYFVRGRLDVESVQARLVRIR